MYRVSVLYIKEPCGSMNGSPVSVFHGYMGLLTYTLVAESVIYCDIEIKITVQ